MGRTRLPRARTDHLVVEDLVDETLIYDQTNDRAHCLNRAARAVWRSCDGKTEVSTAAALVSKEVGLPQDDAVVWLALSRLGKAHLLDDAKGGSKGGAGPKVVSRREVVRSLGLTGGLLFLLPVVDSIVAPLAAQAASCTTTAQCGALNKNQCTGLPICENRSKCCKRQGQGCKAKNC